jgi:hypothetical protein
VPEYLIRTTAGPGSWPVIPKGRLLDVLQPRGYAAVSADGPGDLRLALGGCEMVLSGEDAGWQVWFEGDIAVHDTDALVSRSLSRSDALGDRPCHADGYVLPDSVANRIENGYLKRAEDGG